MDRDTQDERMHWIMRLKNLSYDDKGDAIIGLLVMAGWIVVIVLALLGWIR